MSYLKLVILILASAVITPAFAETCCPSGYVPDFAPNRCVAIGMPQRTAAPVACVGSNQGSSGGGSGGQVYVSPVQNAPGPQCGRSNTTQQWRDEATNRCLSALTGSAQFVNCLFEDDAGRLEDKRTALSCVDRQAALARQCRSICADWALNSNTCNDADTNWRNSFGNISGEHFGSAHVELCGPKLRNGLTGIKKVRVRVPFTP
jgi:hypothetical protein